MARLRLPVGLRRIWAAAATRENLLALALAAILIALVIFTADRAPIWIYQGF